MNRFKSYMIKYYQEQICLSFHKFNRSFSFSQFLLLVRFAWQMQLTYTNKVGDELETIEPHFSNLTYIDALEHMNDSGNTVIYIIIFINCLIFILFIIDIVLYNTLRSSLRQLNIYNQTLFSFFIQCYNYLFFIPGLYLIMSQIQSNVGLIIPFIMSITISVTSIVHDQKYEFQVLDYLGKRSQVQYGLMQCLFEVLSCTYLGIFKQPVGQVIVNMLLAITSLFTLVQSKPFQYKNIRKVSYFYAIYYFLFTLLLMLTIFISKNYAFSFVAIVILPISYNLTNQLEKYQTSFGNIFEFIKERDVQKYDFELRNLIQNVKLEYEDYRLSNISLLVDYIAVQHKLKCSDSSCFCEQTDQSKKDYQTIVISGQQRSFFLNDFIISLYQTNLKQKELRKQPLDTCLCLSYLNYLLYSNRSNVLAFTELVRYRNHPELSFREQSLISELFHTAHQTKKNKQGDKNFMAAINYDEQIEVAEKQFQSTLKMKEEFLIYLFSDYIELKDLRDNAIKLKKQRDEIQTQLTELSKIHYSNSSLQFLLDSYINLLGFGQNKKQLFKRKKLSIFQDKSSKRLNIDQSLFDKDCCIVFVTLVNRIGTIKKYQNKFTQIFGYQHKEVQDKNISFLIPNPVQKHHDFLLSQYIKGNENMNKEGEDHGDLDDEIAIQLIEQQKKGGSLTSEIIKEIILNRGDYSSRFFPMFLAQNGKGWAVPVSLTVKFDSINQDDCGVTGLIQKLHSDYYYMQLDSETFQIQTISEQLYQKVFDRNFIQADIKRIYFSRFAPFLQYFYEQSKKKQQKPLLLSDILRQTVKQGDQKNNVSINNNSASITDIYKTMIFVPKGNTQDKGSVYHHDKPIINERMLQQQVSNYSLEFYDIYVTKFKFYHKEHSLFKYSIVEFHSFRKLTEYTELRETMIKLQKKFQELLSINYDVTDNLNYIEQQQNFQLISHANVNSFIDIIEQEIKSKSNDLLNQSGNQLIQSQIQVANSDRYEENIEATDRNHEMKDYRSHLTHLDPKNNMVSHEKQFENNTDENQLQEKEHKTDNLKNASLLVNVDAAVNQASFLENDQFISKQQQTYLNPPNQVYSAKKRQKLPKIQEEAATADSRQKYINTLDKTFQILSPNDQSLMSYDFDNSRVQLNQPVGLISITDRVGMDDIINNQNNYSLTYTRQNYNESTFDQQPKSNISQLQLHNGGQDENHHQFHNNFNQQQKSYIKDHFEEIEKGGIYSSNNNHGIVSILSPNQNYTSKLSLNTTTSRNLLSHKPQLNNMVLQRLNDEISKETDKGRLQKMQTLKATLKNHQLEDFAVWKLSSSRREQGSQSIIGVAAGGGGIDRKSKLETSYIIRAEPESSADCTDTIDREERIKRELQERSRMVAASSRQSSKSNNTDMKRNVKKSLSSQKRSILMVVLTVFGLLALTSILTLTLYQYFKTNSQFSTIQKDFYYIPWPVDLRSDYTIPLLYSGIFKLIATGQFNSIKDPTLPQTFMTRMQKALNHLFDIFFYYQTADINDRPYFKYINNNPIDIILGFDEAVIPPAQQENYIAEDKVTMKVNLDYFILQLAGFQSKVVYRIGNLNYFEKIQVDNYKTLETQAYLVSDVAQEAAASSNDDSVQQTLILLILVITVSFILISAIFPLYYYVQSYNQACLKLFATISQEQLTTMLKPTQFTLQLSKSVKTLNTVNFNINYQLKYKKRKNITSTSLLSKFKPILLICGLVGFVTLIIQPIVNYSLLQSFKKEVSMNIELLSTLYSIRSLVVSSSALNYQYMAHRTDDTQFLYNAQFYATQIPLVNQQFQQALTQMYKVVQEDQSLSRHNQNYYNNFLYKLLTVDLCEAVRDYPQFVSSDNAFDDTICRSIRSGLLAKGFELAVKDYFSHIQSLEQLYQLKTVAQFQVEIQIWTEQTKIKEFDQYFNILTNSVVIMKDFMIEMMNQYLDYMKFIQTVLLIFQIFALLFLFVFGWLNFYRSIQSEMFLVKQLFSVLSIETVLENPYIMSFLNK